jgi:hypothetical protein
MSQPAFQFDPSRRPSQAENQTVLKSEIPLKERFFRYFQHEITGMSLWYLSFCVCYENHLTSTYPL